MSLDCGVPALAGARQSPSAAARTVVTAGQVAWVVAGGLLSAVIVAAVAYWIVVEDREVRRARSCGAVSPEPLNPPTPAEVPTRESPPR